MFGIQISARQPQAEINMVPLIDIMLVLLVIFMVTMPLLTHAVRVDLPKAASTPAIQIGNPIQLTIRSDGALIWNDDAVSADELLSRMNQAATNTPPPELHIYADAQTPYERVAKVMAQASRSGLTRIGFISANPGEPNASISH